MADHDMMFYTDVRSDNKNLDGVHLFERKGLGKAPFTVIGYGVFTYQAIPGAKDCPIQPGTNCDYCGTAIMYAAKVRSADGKEFKVGLDCVKKTGDLGLHNRIVKSPEYRKIQRDIRHARAKVIHDEVVKLMDEPATKQLAEYEDIRRSLAWSGMAGYARNYKRLKSLLGLS